MLSFQLEMIISMMFSYLNFKVITPVFLEFKTHSVHSDAEHTGLPALGTCEWSPLATFEKRNQQFDEYTYENYY